MQALVFLRPSEAVMMTPERSVEIEQSRVAEQEERIARQRELLNRFMRDGETRLVQSARDVLAEMLGTLAIMRTDLVAAQTRAREANARQADPLDEQSLDAVMRDCPL